MEAKTEIDFPYEISVKLIYSRALQSMIWGLPAVSYDLIYQAFLTAGGAYNQIAYSTKPGHYKNQLLTPNADAVFALPIFNTKISGPLVLEIPKSQEYILVGTIFSCWHVPLQDVGIEGQDLGKGAKYLILPPDYNDTVPSGFNIIVTENFQGYALLRCIPKSDKDVDVARGVIYMEQIKLYPLSDPEISQASKYVDITEKEFDAALQYDISFFESLHRIVQEEPWAERDMVMIDVLKDAGIEKGADFHPDSKKRKILLDAVQDGRKLLDTRYESYLPYYLNSKWFFPAVAPFLNSKPSEFKKRDIYPVDLRAAAYSWGFRGLKRTDAELSQFYLFLIHDRKGNKLDGGRVYTLLIPPDVPVDKYWSVTAYNRDSHTFIKNAVHSSRSSLNLDLKTNKDKSITIYFSATCPAGRESNWITTRADDYFELIFRFYGVQDPVLQKQWVLPDLELLNDP